MLEIVDFRFASVWKKYLNSKWRFILFTEHLDWYQMVKLKKYGCRKRKSHISNLWVFELNCRYKKAVIITNLEFQQAFYETPWRRLSRKLSSPNTLGVNCTYVQKLLKRQKTRGESPFPRWDGSPHGSTSWWPSLSREPCWLVLTTHSTDTLDSKNIWWGKLHPYCSI